MSKTTKKRKLKRSTPDVEVLIQVAHIKKILDNTGEKHEPPKTFGFFCPPENLRAFIDFIQAYDNHTGTLLDFVQRQGNTPFWEDKK